VGRHPNVPREAHVGHALIDEARPALEKTAGMRRTAGQSFRRLLRRAPLTMFVGAVLLLTAVLAGGVLGWSAWTSMTGWAVLLLAVPTVLAASQIALGLVNWLVTMFAAPRPLPRLDFARGIPQDARTMVVVPAMLTSKAGIDQLLQGVEIRYLANADENLHFALLSDFGDHDEEHKQGDDELVDYAAAQIEALALRHGEDADRFMFLHRPRRWNASEGVWMGWERKRGKLTEFNALLRPCDATDSQAKKFSRIVGPRELLYSIHYVITLDADTELPRDAARKLVGTMAHPLNRPVWDDDKQRVVRGYGILQPRVGIDLPSSGKSVFSQLTSGDPGVDPYTRAVSDVYQDAFGEGSFIGKGIYDPEIFEKACGQRFAENRILSHDLIESAFARSGLVSDVTLYEDQPSRYLADVARRHRWMRGDWQIASYVFAGNGPSALSRWKILDNLRRSLIAPAVLLTLVLAWTLRPGSAWAWTLLALGYFFGPALCVFLSGLARKNGELPWSSHVAALTDSLKRDLGRAAMNFVFLPYETFKSLDAVARTLWRLLVSKQRLLEWTTSADAQRRYQSGDSVRSYVEAMWPGVVIAVGVLALVLVVKPLASVLILPIAALWILSPAAAWLISRDLPSTAARVEGRDRHFLSKLSRRTWSFFEQYVGEVDNFLPPDNFQESPAEQVAHRTSPTNIGLALLSNLAAWDFGYITLGTFLDRTGRTLQTCGRLETHESGQLYNWYDTKSLQPLNPRYVSAVDSG
ncbi:MAG: cyclic beta 1-2 glucan synthetase, partial [Planctomycetota bacterium]